MLASEWFLRFLISSFPLTEQAISLERQLPLLDLLLL